LSDGQAADRAKLPGEAIGDVDNVVVLDFGSQYSQLIARRVRELNVYSELLPFDTSWREIAARKPKAVILSGGPNSVYEAGSPHPDPKIWTGGIPILGICYGMQVTAHNTGGKVVKAAHREFGRTEITCDVTSPLFAGLPGEQTVWMSHGDRIETPPPGFVVLARSSNSPVAAMGDLQRRQFGVQFHPEVWHTEGGERIIENFLKQI